MACEGTEEVGGDGSKLSSLAMDRSRHFKSLDVRQAVFREGCLQRWSALGA
jgi:hypothetical protein